MTIIEIRDQVRVLLLPGSSMEDVIIDVIVDGRVLTPTEIPPAVSDQIEAALVNGDEPREIDHEWVCYQWSPRPCVFP